VNDRWQYIRIPDNGRNEKGIDETQNRKKDPGED